MNKIKKCSVCGEMKAHYAFGMCQKCYTKQYYALHREEAASYREAHKEEAASYREAHREEAASYREAHKEEQMTWRRANGCKSISENKECALYLGVHIAEQVLSKVFKNVEMMPVHNPGFDFICNSGKKIDVKSGCRRIHHYGSDSWQFTINHNTIADYFLCLAFDNRTDLNPEHIWLIPGADVNHLTRTSIAVTTLDKWASYKLKIDKIIKCCNTIKGGEI